MRLLRLLAIGFSVSVLGCFQGGPRSSSSRPPEIEWQEYKSEEGGFQVKMPGQPKLEEQGGWKIHSVTSEQLLIGYFVHQGPSPSLFGLISPEMTLKAYQERTIKRDFPQGTVVEVNDLQLGEHPGKEFVLVVEGDDVIRRVYPIKNRIYLVTVSGRNLTSSSRHVKPFFDSFTFTNQKH